MSDEFVNKIEFNNLKVEVPELKSEINKNK